VGNIQASKRTILFAPDSFKGSLTSVEVARALADGWRRARPDDTTWLCPLADGGEGTLEAIAAAGGWTWQRAEVHDPLGRVIPARWLRSRDGARAVIERRRPRPHASRRWNDAAPQRRSGETPSAA
jgi:glycerate kinase